MVAVLIVLASNDRRGAEVEGSQLAAELSRAGHRSLVVALATGSSGSGHATVDVDAVLGASPLGWRTLRALRRTARDYDTVVAYGSTALPACALALAGTGVPFVYRSIGDPAQWVRGAVHRRRTGLLFRRAAHVVALWPGAAESITRLYGVPAGAITCIPNARPPDGAAPGDRRAARAALGLPADGTVVAWVGALAAEKRPVLAVEAVAATPGAFLAFAGEGPLLGEVRAAAERLLPGRHALLGVVSPLDELWDAADVVLLTSSTEGMPGVLIEAGLRGVPAVATDVGAVAEIVADGITGRLVGSDPNPRALAAAIEEVAAAQSTWGDAARHRTTERFTWPVVAPRWAQLLRGDRPLKVMFVIDSLGASGAEHSTVAMMPLLRARGHDVQVASLYDAPHGYEAGMREDGFDVRPLRSTHFAGRVRELRARIREEQPDVVHTALFTGDMVGRLAAWRTGATVISSLVSTPYDRSRAADPNVKRWKLAIVKGLDAVTGRALVHRFHAVSAGVAEVNARDLHLSRARIEVVHRGRSRQQLGEWSAQRRDRVRAALGVADTTSLVLAVGRQEHAKAHVELVAAIPHLRSKLGDLRVLIAGREGNASGPLRAALEANPDVAAVVELLGHRGDVPDLLCAADVLVIPSLYEGTAGVALEAMALRCPVVCTDLAGVRGVLTDGENAVLVPLRDPQALAAALARVLTDPAFADRLRTAGLLDFEQRFTIETATAAMEAFYTSAVRRR